MDQEDMTQQIPAACSQSLLHNKDLTVMHPESAPQQLRSDVDIVEDGLSNGTCDVETMIALHCPGDSDDVTGEGDNLALGNDDMSEFSNSDLSLPEVCISTNSNSFEEEDMNHEVQQAYRIFTGFLLDKHKGITSPFLHPIGHQEAQHGIGGVRSRGQVQLRQSMCLRRMEEKFTNQEYETITEFVADFRLMLENCYRYHGVDHWISKQAQKLEIMLEQKLTLLSRTLREKTTLAVTSNGRFGTEEERGTGGTSTRRRLAPRSLTTITVGGHESVMVQTLRLEEQQRAKEEKRQRELEKKEAEEMSAKEVEEWEQTLLSQASPHTVDVLWELPAIGHFLCLAQTALNLPEIVFFELERCLLMPRCSLLLSKIMSSLLSPPQRRATLHRRPPLPYRRWESELRQRVMAWYRAIGTSHDQPGRAEQLGLCHQFFSTLGEVSPLEEKPFHLLPFYQRVWLLKGLCDHVYETQKSVQDAVLAQPIHECRESILGYDSKENAYIHFPHFCGADLRIYCQSPSTPPAFPFPSVWVTRVEIEPGTEGNDSAGMKAGDNKRDREYYGCFMDTEDSCDVGKGGAFFKRENGDEDEHQDKRFKLWSLKKEEGSESGSSDRDLYEDSKFDLKTHTNPSALSHTSLTARSGVKITHKEEMVESEHQSIRLSVKQEKGFSVRTIEADAQEPCLSVGEHSYTGRSPARSVSLSSPKPVALKMEGESHSQGHQRASCLEYGRNISNAESVEGHACCSGTSGVVAQVSSESTQTSSEERASDKLWTKKKKRKTKKKQRVRGEHDQLQQVDKLRPSTAEDPKSAMLRAATSTKRKDKKKKHKTEKKFESSKKIIEELPAVPFFKLVCTSLDELRELISKTEDELDDLESSKKRPGRWYHRREAVKDLHSTLIRLLNELSPWEPKLVKAYQRNRLRLKKEFDDFKKHPEYSNFVREECISSSSSDEDEERGFEKVFSHTDHYSHYRRSEEEDLENKVPRCLWSGASIRGLDSAGEAATTCIPPIHLKHPLTNTEKGICVLPRVQTDNRNTPAANSGPQSRSELIQLNQYMESDSALASELQAQIPLSVRPTILYPTTGLPKGYTPIPTLLAKSVGNKVTLMKRPADCVGFSNVDKQSKGSLVSVPTSTIVTTKLSKAQSSLPSSQKNSKQMQVQGQQQTEVHRQSGMATVTAALLKSQQVKPTQAVPKSPVQVMCKVPEVVNPPARKDNSSPGKISVHPALNHNTGDKGLQQVVILTSNILVHTNEEKSFLHQQQSKDIQVPVSKEASPSYMSTSVPGFTIPENRIPVQQVAPLRDAKIVRTPTGFVSPCQQQGILKTAGIKRAQICSPLASTPPGIMPNLSPITSSTSAVSTQPIKSTGPKQELKTVCIRDSQSILVTTRGGNTGIVKVQTSSNSGALGSLSTSPIIAISPQFKAFLVSKTSTSFSTAPAQTPPCTIPAVTNVSMAQSPKQVPSVLKSCSTLTPPMPNAVTSSIPISSPRSQTAGITVASTQGSNNSACISVTKKTGQLVQTTTAASHFHFPPVVTNSEFSKTGVKGVCTDESSQVTKFILVSPSLSSTSIPALSKGTSSSTKSLPNSRVMLISQPTAMASTTLMGSIPKQVITTGSSGQLPTTSSSQTKKMGLSQGQSIGSGNSEALSKMKNISLPPGVQVQLSGKTTTIGQMIGALSCSPSKSTPLSVPDTGCPAATTPGMFLVSCSNAVITSSPHLASNASPLRSTPSYTVSPTSMSTSTSTAEILSTENVIKKHLGMCVNEVNSSSPAQVTATVPNSPAQIFPSNIVHQQSFVNTGTTSTVPLTTSATGSVHQRVVINTSTPLAAGTQIILNNTRFVVPPQGLGPGSHVLIISSPAPQQVPAASVVNTGASVPPQLASHVTVSPQAPALPQSPVRLSGVPAASSSVVSCAPAVGSSLVAPTPNITTVQQTGTPVQAAPLLPRQGQTGHFASPPIDTSRLSSVPGLLSPIVTSTHAFGSAPAPMRIAAGTPSRANGSSTILRAGAHPLPRLSTPLSPLPLLPSSSTVSLSSPIIPVPTPVCSTAAPPVPGTHLHCSFTNQNMVSVTVPGQNVQQTAITIAAPSTALAHALLHTGLGNTSVRKHVPAVMQPVLAGTRTQVLPTMSVPPIVSVVSRMQPLPIATVPPIGSTANTFETVPVVTTPASSSAVEITSGQSSKSLKTNNTIHPPVILTNQALVNQSWQTSAIGIHTNAASKLLISPDGAVLSTARCQVNPAELTTCPKPLEALVVYPNSSSGVLHMHDSSLPPSQADTR